ncbi:aldo/keto reductase [Acinetobacter pragensis]|uniref:2,5-diketo-D-gluconic acid reductase n=1 Tax=Acinetobacter pragensis TaxID=1806892 RepID=A0A151Y3V1_9GAMM|nr:aldo/keto reductase [Acinetobacter pragensis]KYQ72713.1 2,5-diketo-D-gluconic acid reductase [Acinetobacter pragensis]
MIFTTLNNGVKMPILGFGVFQMLDQQQCEDAVYHALMTGYRHIDTAAAYENEDAVGRAIRRCEVPREELFITSKLWVQDAGYETAHTAFQRSLERLGLDYLDLYLIHQPYSDVYGSWHAMQELYDAGKIKAIGVSNFSIDRIADLIAFNRIIPAVNQIETHPFTQQIAAQRFLKARGIQHEAWAPFAEGKNDIFQNEILKEIADVHGKSVAQVILRWLIQREIAVIPKSVNAKRIEENFDVFSFELSEQDIQRIQALDTGAHLIADHRNPERIEQIARIRFNT